MKVFLSKGQWERIGHLAGWLKVGEINSVSGTGGFFFAVVEALEGGRKAVKCEEGVPGCHYCSYTGSVPADPRAGPAEFDLECEDVSDEDGASLASGHIPSEVFREELWESLKSIAEDQLWEDFHQGRV